MKLLWPLLPLIASLAPVQGPGLAELADPRNAVLGEKYAYLPLQARAAAIGIASRMAFSGDGRGLLIARTLERWDRYALDFLAGNAVSALPDPEWILTWHDVETGASRDVWKGKDRQFIGFEALDGAPFVIAESYARQGEAASHQVHIVGAGGLRLLAQSRADAETEVEHLDTAVSPLKNGWASLTYRSNPQERGSANSPVLRILDAAGKVSSYSMPSPPGTVLFGLTGWTQDGQSVIVGATRFERGLDQAGNPVRKAETSYTLVDRRTGSMSTNQPFDVAQPDAEPKGEILLDGVPANAVVGQIKFKTGATLLVSRDGKSHAVIFPGVADGVLAPNLEAVAYSVEGAVFVRRLAKLDRAKMEKLADEAGRREAMTNAKQAALAALMYGNDYDDMMPGASQDIAEILLPYMKSRDALSQFVYVFEGGDITKVGKPAETVLGYVRYKGGRAVAYLDGHVVWIPDP